MTWYIDSFGESHPWDGNVNPADVKGYVLNPVTGALHPFGQLPPDEPKETA